jgi:hypothetical protein
VTNPVHGGGGFRLHSWWSMVDRIGISASYHP